MSRRRNDTIEFPVQDKIVARYTIALKLATISGADHVRIVRIFSEADVQIVLQRSYGAICHH